MEKRIREIWDEGYKEVYENKNHYALLKNTVEECGSTLQAHYVKVST